MPGLRGRLWRGARVVVTGLAVGFILCEVLLRVARFAGFGGVLFYARQDLYWKIFPMIGSVEELATVVPGGMGPYGRMHGYVLNSRGLRTPEYSVERKPGVSRVVLLGDSFLCLPGGPDDSKNIANVIDRQLNAEVVNLGLPTAGPKFYLRMLEIEGVRLKPDCLVLFFFVGNDFTEEGDVGPDQSLEDFLVAHSYLYRLVRNLPKLSHEDIFEGDYDMRHFRMGEERRGGYFDKSLKYWPGRTLSQKQFEEVQARRAVVFIDPWPDWLEEHWGMLQETIRQIYRVGADYGIPLLFVLVPDQSQVEPEVRSAILRGLGGLKADFGAPQRRLKLLCAEAGIPVLDLLPAFKSANDSGKKVYLERDTHWNPYGQELAGRLVAEKIRGILAAKKPVSN